MGLLKWWRGRRWEYLGYTKLEYSTTSKLTGKTDKEDFIIHFYVWVNNNKKRKVTTSRRLDIFHQSPWYNTDCVPWLEGGDMWKPIGHPVAVRGNLINYMTRSTTPTPPAP